jgi:hypothetical protein
MKTLKEIAEALAGVARSRKIPAKELACASGITPQTLVNIFKHHGDFRVSNLLALSDRLGLEILLVPKGSADGLRPAEHSHAPIKSKVDLALERVRPAPEHGTP